MWYEFVLTQVKAKQPNLLRVGFPPVLPDLSYPPLTHDVPAWTESFRSFRYKWERQRARTQCTCCSKPKVLSVTGHVRVVATINHVHLECCSFRPGLFGRCGRSFAERVILPPVSHTTRKLRNISTTHKFYYVHTWLTAVCVRNSYDHCCTCGLAQQPRGFPSYISTTSTAVTSSYTGPSCLSTGDAWLWHCNVD